MDETTIDQMKHDAAEQAVAAAAQAAAERARERALLAQRILAGGRPGGLHQIAEGLRQREQQRRGDH